MTASAPPSLESPGNLYLVGTGVAHAMAPVIHNCVAAQLRSPWRFSNLDVGDKAAALAYIRRHDFRGCVPTMPLKTQLLDCVDELDDAARAIGAINNIYKRGDRLLGANTDWIGITKALQKSMGAQATSSGRRRGLIVGAGGASRAAAYALAQLHCSVVYVINRDAGEVQALFDDINRGFGDTKPKLVYLSSVEQANDFVKECADADSQIIAVSCVPDVEPTSDGEKTASAVLNVILAGARRGTLLEMAYKPRITRTFQAAQRNGWCVIEGIHVIAEQVQTVWALFAGVELTDAQAQVAQRELWKQAALRDDLNVNGVPDKGVVR